jgi:hypothetical protein
LEALLREIEVVEALKIIRKLNDEVFLQRLKSREGRSILLGTLP